MKKKKKNIIIGLTGSIAAYKIPQMASDLRKKEFNVFAVLTENALKFVTLCTMEGVTANPAFSAMFYLKSNTLYPHIDLTRNADMLIIAPATANFIAKASCGIADDLLSTIFLASTCPKLIAPAMNERMLFNDQTKENISSLKKKGVLFMNVETGRLACGETGKGRMASPKNIIKRIEKVLS